MKRISLKCLSALAIDDQVLILTREANKLSLRLFDIELEVADKIVSFEGTRGFILKSDEDKFLVSGDNQVYLVEGDKCKPVLRGARPENVFWHAVETEDMMFVQEYGTSTSIYASKDLQHWERLVSNTDLDKSSRHFHYITYDPYRNWVIATLGDGCLTRSVVSEDLGKTWTPLYKGPWQFMPIVPLRDKIIFGMDSSIVKGGIGVYYPQGEKWSFIFLKCLSKEAKLAQMNDLKLLDNNTWVAALGIPQAVVISNNLRTWYSLYIEGFDNAFNYYMAISERMDFIACWTGKSLVMFKRDDLKEALRGEPILTSYKVCVDRLVGLGFVLKKRILTRSV